MRTMAESLLALTRWDWLVSAAWRMREGREERFLETDAIVLDLIVSLRDMEDEAVKAGVNGFLDLLATDLVKGKEWTWNDTVMAVFYALKRTGKQLDKVEFVANSKSAEIARLSRFARRLLKDDDS